MHSVHSGYRPQGMSFLRAVSCFYSLLLGSHSGTQRVPMYLQYKHMKVYGSPMNHLFPFWCQFPFKNYLLSRFSNCTKVERIVCQTMYSPSTFRNHVHPFQGWRGARLLLFRRSLWWGEAWGHRVAVPREFKSSSSTVSSPRIASVGLPVKGCLPKAVPKTKTHYKNTLPNNVKIYDSTK